MRQAEQALRIYFVNFLKRADRHRRPANAVVDQQGRTSPLAALEQLRIAREDSSLFLSNRVHVCGLGTAVARLCRRSSGGTQYSRGFGVGARLRDSPRGAPEGVGQHAESGVPRDPCSLGVLPQRSCRARPRRIAASGRGDLRLAWHASDSKTASAGGPARSSRSCAVADHQAGAAVFPRDRRREPRADTAVRRAQGAI